jgi:serine/threonine protein kinase
VEYTPALKLLQDLCTRSGELPSSFQLNNVAVNRQNLVGRGGEVLVYAGYFGDQKVVVRETVMPRGFWSSPEGKKIIKVTADLRSKVIPCLLHFDIQLVHREAITHSLLDHPNVIRFLGVFTEHADSPPMVVLPFVERGSLSDLLRRNAVQGVEFAWIVCLIALHSRNQTFSFTPTVPTQRLLGLAAR